MNLTLKNTNLFTTIPLPHLREMLGGSGVNAFPYVYVSIHVSIYVSVDVVVNNIGDVVDNNIVSMYYPCIYHVSIHVF